MGCCESIGSGRELLQFGAELFGSSSRESDCEIIRLMIEGLRIAGIGSLSVSLGHIGIIDNLIQRFGFKGSSMERLLLEALNLKSKPELEALNQKGALPTEARNVFSSLIELNGGIEVVDEAWDRLKDIGDGVPELLEQFKNVVWQVATENEDVSLNVDYAQVGGYQYHTGVIFSAYGPGYGQPLAKGGRYDRVMAAYGMPCAATGFSGDLHLLRRAIRGECRKAILIPSNSAVPKNLITELIDKGERVIHQLPDQTFSSLKETCDRVLSDRSGQWQIIALNTEEDARLCGL